MSCSEIFWAGFLKTFPETLGGALGVVPGIIAFIVGLFALLHAAERFMQLFERWGEARLPQQRPAREPASAVVDAELRRIEEIRRGNPEGRDV